MLILSLDIYNFYQLHYIYYIFSLMLVISKKFLSQIFNIFYALYCVFLLKNIKIN